ncbi:MAG: hypothetical protein AAGI08_13110, partial [Bacteroidota bacterium]
MHLDVHTPDYATTQHHTEGGFRNTFGRRMASVDGRALPLFVKMMLGLKDNRPPKVRMLSTSDLQAP